MTNSPGFYYFCARQFRQLSLFGLVRSFLFFLHIFLQQGKQKIRLSIIKYASNNLLTVAVLDPKQHINTCCPNRNIGTELGLNIGTELGLNIGTQLGLPKVKKFKIVFNS